MSAVLDISAAAAAERLFLLSRWKGHDDLFDNDNGKEALTAAKDVSTYSQFKSPYRRKKVTTATCKLIG